jgi:hypothetical protein
MLGRGIRRANPDSVFQNFVVFVTFVVKNLLQTAMAAVAEGFVLGMSASAPRHGFSRGQINFYGREFCAGVRAITEGLAAGSTARAPKVGAGLLFLHNGTLLKNDGFAHAFLLFLIEHPLSTLE